MDALGYFWNSLFGHESIDFNIVIHDNAYLSSNIPMIKQKECKVYISQDKTEKINQQLHIYGADINFENLKNYIVYSKEKDNELSNFRDKDVISLINSPVYSVDTRKSLLETAYKICNEFISNSGFGEMDFVCFNIEWEKAVVLFDTFICSETFNFASKRTLNNMPNAFYNFMGLTLIDIIYALWACMTIVIKVDVETEPFFISEFAKICSFIYNKNSKDSFYIDFKRTIIFKREMRILTKPFIHCINVPVIGDYLHFFFICNEWYLDTGKKYVKLCASLSDNIVTNYTFVYYTKWILAVAILFATCSVYNILSEYGNVIQVMFDVSSDDDNIIDLVNQLLDNPICKKKTKKYKKNKTK